MRILCKQFIVRDIIPNVFLQVHALRGGWFISRY